MARGAIAKQKVTQKIAEAFGSNYIGEYDKKIYVQADDGGETVQIAISMTCPKTQIQISVGEKAGGFDFSDNAEKVISTSAFEPAEQTEDELDRVKTLMAQLGL